MQRVFRKTIKAKLSFITVFFTLILTIFMGSVIFYTLRFYLERNLIQTTAFSLQLVMDNVESDMNDLTYLSKWCGSNRTIADFLVYDTDSAGYKNMTLDAYDRLKEEYQNSRVRDYIKRIVISSNNNNFIQIISYSNDRYNSDPEAIRALPFFDELYASDKVRWIGIVENPLTKNIPEQVIPVLRPIYSSYRSSIIGFAYITVSARVITDNFNNYNIEADSNIYLRIGEKAYILKDGILTETPVNYHVIRQVTDSSLGGNTRAEEVRFSDGSKRTLITYASSLKGWTLSQTLSEKQFSAQKRQYYMVLVLACSFIVFLGTFLTLYLNHIINSPIGKIRNKIKDISSGNFTEDPSIEWDNELGEIGRGINTLSVDIVSLMDKRIADEKQKNDLEYQVLLNQVNPHFLYNTLNSVKWMATIQNASGIAEVVTSLAVLLKKISKVNTSFTSLREELSMLEDYFLIQKYRYGGIISLECKVESEDLYECLIPRFSLQPLVENAIFHGIEPKGEAGNIYIHVKPMTEMTVRIDITDDGVGMTEDKISAVLMGGEDTSSGFFKGIGIANVNRRLKYTYGPEYGLSITSEVGSYTTMTIMIPYNKG